MAARYDVLIIGGGVLGTAISYYMAHLGWSVAVAEQEAGVARHASGRNTGKVHAPHMYDPRKRRMSARAAFCGYGMWEEYAASRGLPFERDGVLEVALDDAGAATLERHRGWAVQNGLDESDVEMLDSAGARGRGPGIRCESALYVGRDASTDYAALTRSLMADSRAAGAVLLAGARVAGIARDGDGWLATLGGSREVRAGFLVNAAGGEAVDVAHAAGVGRDLADIHFRGEYWQAPPEYRSLAGTSVYCAPEFPEYPFLDPHWIVRAGGACEIGPNAVPVFSPYGYGAAGNARALVPKALEMLRSGARRAVLGGRFRKMAAREAWSSLSRRAMVGRVRRFLPGIDPARITVRGTAGIRSSVVDAGGRFLHDPVVLDGPSSLHVLNYNSPGATGALPFAAHVTGRLAGEGLFGRADDAVCGPWRFADAAAMLD